MRVNDNQSDAMSDGGSLYIRPHASSNVSELIMNKDNMALAMNRNRPISQDLISNPGSEYMDDVEIRRGLAFDQSSAGGDSQYYGAMK